MQSRSVSVAFAASLGVVASAGDANPVGKVVQLLSDLQTKIIAEGEAAQKAYVEYSEWCEERSANLGFEIKTQKSEVDSLKATIAEESSLSDTLSSKIDGLVNEISTDEADLKAATSIRAKEQADFAASEKELVEVVDTLQRAITILERELRKTGGASMMQLKNAGSVAEALNVLVQGSMLNSADASRLTALVQQQDSDGGAGAPAAAVYTNQSGGIIQTLTDLLEKAQDQLATARKEETNNIHSFELMQQGLKDEIKFGKKDMSDSKKGLAESASKKAAAEGDLAQTSKSLAGDENTLKDLHQNCLTFAQNYEAETKSRGEELKAIAQAKQVITSETVGAEGATYGLAQESFLQTHDGAVLNSGADLANFEAVRFVRELARQEHSSALALLATRMGNAMRAGSAQGQDPFGKVKGLIKDMIEKLQAEAESDATHKAYCDKELAESTQKQADKEAEIAKLSTKIDGMQSRSAQLKSEVAGLQQALAKLAAAQAEMNKMRAEENAAFKKNKADMEQGLEGVKLALKILREYYGGDAAHAAAEGAGNGIIGLLEVVESDFSQALAEFMTVEETAARTYDEETKANEIEKTTKEQDIKYKNKESTELNEAVSEATSDRSGVETELAAVNEYLKSLAGQCITTGGNMGTEGHNAESYEQRIARRAKEIAGLKEALTILDGEAVLLQSKHGKKISMRGSRLIQAM